MNRESTSHAYPPDLGSGYSWPHGPECVYVLSRGIEWCTCRGQFAGASRGRGPTTYEYVSDACGDEYALNRKLTERSEGGWEPHLMTSHEDYVVVTFRRVR